VQRDLALQAGIPHHLTWIFPAIVDGAILGSTIAVVALSKIGGSAIGKRFFLGLAVVVVFINFFGNANHAYRAGEAAARNVAAGIELGYTPLSPTGASLIAIIPPLLVLAFTHGIGILIKAIGTAHMEYSAVVRDPRHREQQWAGEDTGTDSRNSAPKPRSVDRNAGRNAQLVASTAAPGVDVASAAESSEPDRARAAATRPDMDRDVAAALQPKETDPADLTGVAGQSEEHQKRSIRNALHSPAAAAQEISNAPDDPPQSFVLPDETQTIDNLLAFIDACADFEPIVKETARLRISEQRSYAEIATLTNAKAASTAMRRFDKVAQRAVEEGFRTPPLPEIDDATEGRKAATLDQQYAFAGALQ
jgi:hypothetical protein